jgi:hypothetical protein
MDPKDISRLIFGVVCFVLLATNTNAAEKASEYEVKAAYLYNFAKFVQWPEDGGASFDICILGTDPFGGALGAIVEGESLRGRRVVIRATDRSAAVTDCNMVFVAASERSRITQIVESLEQRPVLTVSDIPQFAEKGGVIGFVNKGGRVRFEVNLTAAQEAKLVVGSGLLSVAAKIYKHPAQ